VLLKIEIRRALLLALFLMMEVEKQPPVCFAQNNLARIAVADWKE